MRRIIIRKLLSSFTNAFILGVTATPLSSNIKLPMHESYELIVGDTISSLINNGFSACTTYSYDVSDLVKGGYQWRLYRKIFR
jgi:superfamily II DNA or RNA helicase